MVDYLKKKIDRETTLKKNSQENLHLLLKEAFVYHRDSISMVFKVTLTCGTVFTGLMAVYVTMSSGDPNLDFQKMRLWVAWVGTISSLVSLFVQWLSIKAYLLSGHLYLHPLRELAGLKNIPPTGGKKRSDLEFNVALVLYMICVVYLVAWLWLLKYNHCFSGCLIAKGGINV